MFNVLLLLRFSNIFHLFFFFLVVDLDHVVVKSLKELRSTQLIPEYEKHEENIKKALKKAAQTEAELTSKMFPMIDNHNMLEVENEMKAVIGRDRVSSIKKSFGIETYRMEVVKKPDGRSAVQVRRKGVECHPERALEYIKDIEHVSNLQWTSLGVEIYLFVLSCAGIEVAISDSEMTIMLREAEIILREPEIRTALTKVVETWHEAGKGSWKKAKAIFVFLSEVFTAGIFWKMIKLIFQNLSQWDLILTTAEIAVMIVAALATEGLALIARLALAVDGAYHLEKKIENLVTFSVMKKTM